MVSSYPIGLEKHPAGCRGKPAKLIGRLIFQAFVPEKPQEIAYGEMHDGV
jgi:hypothetical protein